MSRASRSLSSGVTRPKTCRLGQPACAAPRRSGPGSSAPLIAPGPRPERLADRVGGHRVVAGDHADVDAGLQRDLDGHLRRRPQRVDDADEPDEAQLLGSDIGSASWPSLVVGDEPRGEGEDAQALLPHPRVLRLDLRRHAPPGDACRSSGPPASVQRASTTSGPPLTSSTTRDAPSTSILWNVAMNLYSESNGTSASRGYARRVSRRRPPAWRRAPRAPPRSGRRRPRRRRTPSRRCPARGRRRAG